MIKNSVKKEVKKIASHKNLPLLVERGQDGFYVAECPVLEGCYSQGKTLDEALSNIREVIALILEDKKSQKILAGYHPAELSWHTISVAV